MNHSKTGRALLFGLALSAAVLQAQAACFDNTNDHDSNTSEIASLLPAESRGALAVDLKNLLDGDSSSEVNGLLDDAGDPALSNLFSSIDRLAGSAGVEEIDTAVLTQFNNASADLVLIAKVSCDTLGDLGADLTDPEPYRSHAIYPDGANSVALVGLGDGGTLIAGSKAAVEAVLDVVDDSRLGNSSTIEAFLGELQSGTPFSFVYGLPALFDSSIPDDSITGAAVVSGSLVFSGTNVSGSASFHTTNADAFAAAYNALNEAAGEPALVVNPAIANDLKSVLVEIPSTPIVKNAAQLITSRNTLRKLSVVMDAYGKAQDVGDSQTQPGDVVQQPWMDLIVSSEQEGNGELPSSVFIRREFKDAQARRTFEQNYLPPGFVLAPTRFFESDPAQGLYFVALNLYNSAGGLVGGARAEWDTFVYPVNPDEKRYDPDGKERPWFMVFDALAQAVSADPKHGLTPAEPMSHTFQNIGGTKHVVSDVKKNIDDTATPVFHLEFPAPVFDATAPESAIDPANLARFTREMAIGNDQIYWEHRVYDHVLYNATTFNWDAHFIDVDDVTYTDYTPWKGLLNDTPTDIVYYVNTLEYVVSPWANLDVGPAADPQNPQDDELSMDQAWWDILFEFKNNGNYKNMMNEAVSRSFKGQGDTLYKPDISNAVPSVYYNFLIGDVPGLEADLELPRGYSIVPTSFFDGGTEDYYLTLAVYEVDDAIEGIRAEWSVVIDDGSGSDHTRRTMIIDLHTEDAALDPYSMINLPGPVDHGTSDGTTLATRLSSASISFSASFDSAGTNGDAIPSLDWLEARDIICQRNGICDKLYYDAGTLDELLRRPSSVTLSMSTPWDDYLYDDIESTAVVFYRDNLQEFVVKPWENGKVFVANSEPPETGGGTHDISGSGVMIGRTSSIIDSDYEYFGSAYLSDNTLYFTIEQQISNILTVTPAQLYLSGSFDLTGPNAGQGTSEVLDCIGPNTICGAALDSKANNVIAPYTASNLNASDPNNITWDVSFELDLGTNLGMADSNSSLRAQVEGAEPPEQESGSSSGCVYRRDTSIDMLLMMLLACSIFYLRNRMLIRSHS